MKRCLHITINERGGAEPQGAPTHHPYQPYPETPDSSDPGGNISMPPPDGRLISPPSYSTTPSAGGTGAHAAEEAHLACSCACCCACACNCGAPAGSSPTSTSPSSSSSGTVKDYSGFVIVRLAAGVLGNSRAENLWTLARTHSPELTELEAILELPIHPKTSDQKTDSGAAQRTAMPATDSTVTPVSGAPTKQPPPLPDPPPGVLVSRPLVELQGPEMTRALCLEKINGLEKKAATSLLPPLHSLAAYWRLDVRQYPDLVDEVIRRLRALPQVDLAYRELTAKDAGVIGQIFADDQGYLDDAPVGVGARWAWQSLAGVTAPLTIYDLEQGWDPGHQDFKDNSGNALVPTT